jgi:steroid delta-isomerase
MKKSRWSLFGLASVAACCLASCASAPKQDPMVFTEQALATTDPLKVKGPVTTETNAIARFEAFNGDFSAENITNNTANVYAAGVYFRDPFKEIHGQPDFEAYLLKSSTAIAQYSMDWKDVAESDGNYYFRWVMSLKLKRDGKDKPPSLTLGISLVRFGADGKVIFQQDYYDAAAFLYEKIPILGSEIRFIKKRL